jgi:protein-L-isoaspartate(D-aspartate) O-methyltransferase
VSTDHHKPLTPQDAPDYLRARMIAEQLRGRSIRDERVLAAFDKVPRHLFCPGVGLEEAYGDHPVDIGCDQTISQPYMVAWMLEAARLQPADWVLEVGTGSGYQTALLSQLVARVFSIERIPELLDAARERLGNTSAENVTLKSGDGGLGWPEHAPFECILVTAAAPTVPEPLRRQLAVGGRLLAPVGSRWHQELVRVERLGEVKYREESLGGCVFVPLRGVCGWQD